MLVQLFCWPARRRCSRGSAPSSAPGGASRTEPPLRMPAMPSRFSFASSSTYRKGSPRYRRAFSAYVNSLYMRHADDARYAVPYSRHADDARGGVPPLQRLGALRGRSPRYACPLCRQHSVTLRFRRDSCACSSAKIYLARYACPLHRVPLQAQLAQIAVRHRLHLIQTAYTS